MIQLLDFFADWCGPCQVMKPVFTEIENEFAGKMDFRQVDVEEEPEEARKYGVMSIPTYIVLKDGEEVARKMGAMRKEVLSDWLKNYTS